MTTLTHLCAVGDSFVYGDELIETYYYEEFCIPKNENWAGPFYSEGSRYAHYITLLDKLRFTKLVADEFKLLHLNYSARGASIEGIKLQTYLLVNMLKRKNIDLGSTLWLVGLTLPSRKLFLNDPSDNIDYTNIDIEQVWSGFTSQTLFTERDSGPTNFSANLIKELTVATSPTMKYVSWLMHVLDIIHLLKSAGVKQIHLLNVFESNFETFDNLDKLSSLKLLKKLSQEIESILPSKSTSLGAAAALNKTDLCVKGHYNQSGHLKVAKYITHHLKDIINDKE